MDTYLEKAIETLGMEVLEFSNRNGIPFSILTKLTKGDMIITSDIASKLSLLFGTGTEVWMNLLARNDSNHSI